MHFKCTGYSHTHTHTHIRCIAPVKTTVVCERCELRIVEEAQWKNKLGENQVTVSYNTHTVTTNISPIPFSLIHNPTTPIPSPSLPPLSPSPWQVSLPTFWRSHRKIAEIQPHSKKLCENKNAALGGSSEAAARKPREKCGIWQTKQNSQQNGNTHTHTHWHTRTHTFTEQHKRQRALAASG